MGKQNIVCFGELLLRYSPANNAAWIPQHSMPVYIGGAELNVASALANWGLGVNYCTALPNNFIAQDIIHSLQQKKINTKQIVLGGNRIGVYYIAEGKDVKNSAVLYDRAGSAFADLKPGMINWELILEDASWFHFSAITPALSKHLAAVCKEALVVAAKKGITISVDLNYRSKLWQYGLLPVEVMPELVAYCDIVMGNIWSANTLLGMALPAKKPVIKNEFIEQAFISSKNIQKLFPKSSVVANTFRFDESGIQYYASLYMNEEQYISPEFTASSVVDKIGSGDCFMAGLIYGLTRKDSPQEIIDFSAAAAFGKLQELGDSTHQTVEQIKQQLIK